MQPGYYPVFKYCRAKINYIHFQIKVINEREKSLKIFILLYSRKTSQQNTLSHYFSDDHRIPVIRLILSSVVTNK